jgi:glucuronate isomerase
MKPFLDQDFLLQTETAKSLYHGHAKGMPIFDYHCHLPPEEIARDKQHDNIGEIWLGGDHYKWRAMRTNGVSEDYCTGDKPWREKFRKWAETVPHTLRNPLYHWTHMELQRYFGINTLLSGETADEIFDACTEQLRTPEFSTRNLLSRMKVEVVGTTDDPVDSLEHHRKIAADGFGVKVVPSFRPDKAMNLSDTGAWKAYVGKLEEVSGMEIKDWASLIGAIENRADYFHELGCRVSDHGIAYVPDASASEAELDIILTNALAGESISFSDQEKFQAMFLYDVGKLYHARNWAQ